MSHLNSSFVPAGIGLWRSMAGAGVMAVGAVLAFHGLSDSASWLPPFVGIGDTLTGGIVFSAGLVLLLLPAAGRRRARGEAPPPPTPPQASEPSVDTAGIEALIRWHEKVHAPSADIPAPSATQPVPVGSGRGFPEDAPAPE